MIALAARTSDIKSILDLGCFDGTLTRKIVRELNTIGSVIETVTAVEPADQPLKTFASHLDTPEFSKVHWTLIEKTMESFLSDNRVSFDLAIASHSLYWIGENDWLVQKIPEQGRFWAIVIRDEGLLHQLESKYRPMMTDKKKRFISTKEIRRALSSKNIVSTTHHFEASMEVPPLGTTGFKSLVGFLLDLELSEIDEQLLPMIYTDLSVKEGRARYGIDVVWNLDS